MIWLAWRQFRIQALVAAVALAVTTLVLVLSGLRLRHLYTAGGLSGCTPGSNAGRCTQGGQTFLNEVNASLGSHLPLLFGTALVVVPALIGMFWGAPLITRELEAGTHRLALGQSVSRTRWLAIKLGLTGLAGLITAGLFSYLVTWSAAPIDAVNGDRLTPAVFSERGIAPAGYAVFALALGVAAGMLIRRTVPAMAATLAVFTAVQFAMRALRQYLIAPLRAVSVISGNSINIGVHGSAGSLSTSGPAVIPGAWVYSTQLINAAGHAIAAVPITATGPVSVQTCAGGQQGPPAGCFAALARQGYRQLVLYQPASRFWAFQWYETAIFLALALALTGFCFWWVRNRLA
jgi:hypothetical protein